MDNLIRNVDTARAICPGCFAMVYCVKALIVL